MTDNTRELRPAGRYEWEQIIRRARLGTVIRGSGRIGSKGKATKGGMSGTTFTGIALGWASYGNDKGREIWPGDATVAIDLETSIAAVRQVRQALVRLGLMEMVRRRTGTRGDEYRLTLPTDLLDVVEVLTPAQHKMAANRLREAARGKPRGGSGGHPTDPDPGDPADHPEDEAGSPVDHPESDTDDSLGDPADHPNVSSGEEPGWSSGYPESGSGWSGGPALGGPADTHTDHDRTRSTTDHAERDLRTAVTVSRASGAAEEPDPAIEETTAPDARPVDEPRGCPAHGPAMAAGLRPDGKPACPLCRRGAPPTVLRRDPDDDPEAEEARQVVNGNWLASQTGRRAVAPRVRDQLTAERLADVVPLRPRTA